MEWLSETWMQLGEEIWRVRWMLVIAVGVILLRGFGILQETSPTLLVLYKLSLAAIGFIAAHIGYQQAFPYIDQAELLRRATGFPEAPSTLGDTSEDRRRYAILFAGTSVLRGLIYAAFVLGVTLGL